MTPASEPNATAPVRSWEPVTIADLDILAALVGSTTTVEGGAAAHLAARASTPVGELVAWAWVVDRDRTHALLVDHRRFGVWMPPGGRTRPGEPTLMAAARELLEETGVTGTPVHDHPALIDAIGDATPDGTAVTTYGVGYLFVADRSSTLLAESGQPSAWWPIDAPPERRSLRHWNRLVTLLCGSG